MTNPVNGALSELLSRVDRDPSVVGVVVSGSQARDGMVTPYSDTDVMVIVDAQGSEPWLGSHSPLLDIAVYTLEELGRPAMPRENLDAWWNRYAFTHSQVIRDTLEGEIQVLVDAQAVLTGNEASTLSLDFLTATSISRCVH